MIASRVLLRAPLAAVARRTAATGSLRSATRAYSSQASSGGSGIGSTLAIALVAAGAGAAGYHFYAQDN
ncbi:hypothetical protein BGZ98_002881, partial [Dissophora globulifera]